ncbi:MAG: SpoIVB peptidase S55 domain-containing protein [Nannocystaceae bacterium]
MRHFFRHILGRTRVRILALSLLGGAAFAHGEAVARKPVPIMPVEDVRPGMRGEAYTVFSGTEPEPFAVEIIDVIPAYLPGQDLILFRALDPRVVHTGIAGGMSGSPIYIDGKLIGALAYGWRFNKDPIGGITPIENMLEVDKLKYRPEVLPTARSRGLRQGTRAWADQLLGLDTSPLPPKRRAHVRPEVEGIEPLGIPLSVGGLGTKAVAYLGDVMGMTPARGGGGRHKGVDAGPKTWRPGDSVSVVLSTGDTSVAPNGTVTWVGGRNGERLLAYGHPMSSLGPTNLPIADARVHVIIPSRRRSVKLSSPGRIRGTMVQDRQSAIALRTSITAPVIPLFTTVRSGDRDLAPRRYRNQIAESASLTPEIVATVLIDALDEAAPDNVACTARVRHELAIETSRGPRTVRIQQETYFPRGVTPARVARHRAIVLLGVLLDNDFEVAKVRSVTQTAEVVYGRPVERIEEVRVASGEARPGQLIQLEVHFRRPHGGLRTQIVMLRVPEDAARETIIVEIAGGASVRPYHAVPKTLDDLIDTVEHTYPARAIVASIYRESEGLSTEYGLLRNLPDSVLEALSHAGTTAKNIRFKHLARRVIKMPTLIAGSHRLKLRVQPRRLID